MGGAPLCEAAALTTPDPGEGNKLQSEFFLLGRDPLEPRGNTHHSM